MSTVKEQPRSMDDFMVKISSTVKARKERLLIFAGDGDGKTTFAAQFKNGIFAMTPGEDGLLTLMNSGQLTDTPFVDPIPDTFDKWMKTMLWFAEGKHEYDGGPLIIDTLNGVQSLLFSKILTESFHGNDVEFGSWAAGERAAVKPWEDMLHLLDRIRLERNMSIIMLCHKAEAKYENPTGKDHTRFVPALSKWLWGPTGKWTDITLFFDRVTVVTEEKGKTRGKATGGVQRICHAARSATHDAKNRHGLPDMFKLGDSAAESWKIFTGLLKKAKGSAK